ncbi:restriction endonuclease subunit S [Chromohalobacter israelensis]|uniref:restriction endonuclease subunit S n=1 Tax=Chromohalobacter israelensis TaxID=141390 RepID=UPI000D71B1C9|nr:restriction endonuclease subunit S [Chromohalobacter salexigens]PWW32847.1 type I restriction enzyme S subunit [Chromohalobacter salexigens]
MSARELITDHLDLWTGAVTHKSGSGRNASGKNGKIELTGIKKLRELVLKLGFSGFLTDDTPKAWESVTLGDIGKWGSGGTPTKSRREFYGGDIPWLVIGDLNDGIVRGAESCITEEGLENSSAKLVPPGALLIAMYGSIGKLGITEITCATNQAIAHCIPEKTKIDLRFLFFFLLEKRESLLDMGQGLAQQNISQRILKRTKLDLPSLDVQHRIVEKIYELMALCDRLEQQVGDQLEAHEVLVDTLLDALTRSTDAAELAENWVRVAEHFDTLFTTEASIDKLKKTILQLAVMGRLVEQNPNAEPANSLLARLSEERQAWLEGKKDKDPECATMLRKLKKLSSPNPPFDLPSGWEAAHLIQLCKILVDCHNKTAPYTVSGIPIIRTSNIRERKFRLNDVKYVSKETYKYWSRRCPPQPKDIIFTREAPMGEAAIIPEDKRWCLGQRTMLIRPMLNHINEEYLLLALTEPNLLNRATEKAIGSTVKHLRVGDVEALAIPVPPLNEQHRIVEKVNELMALCDQLKTRLSECGKTRSQLAETVVEQAVS